ncbi:MAG: flagellar basal body P-ring formation chaperone FlgA [Rickettsiales bacterium]|jgi:flagella basal body P-ring formation protein FlgA|nr:flagellar basal body P-ring formation chaperone FlgA [Rickettsiales bacterium]
MSIIFRNLVASCAVGFVIPTLAFATIEEPPVAISAPKQIFELSAQDAEGAIGFALAERGAGQRVVASIQGRNEETLFSYNSPISVEIRGLQYDRTNSRWSASLMFVSDGQVISAMPVSGRYDEVMQVPVLKRQVRPGDVIQEADLELRDFSLSRTRSDTIADLSALVGKAPIRSISAGRPIREQEIAQPAVIKKNDIIQVEYRSQGVSITTTAQAMEDGSKGSTINVRNLSSKKLVRAIVQDEKTVIISSSGARYAAVN